MVGSDGRVMVPDEFLPQARRFGMMPTIDRFMLTRAIELARAGRRVDVNISAATINDAATMSAIVEELQRAGDVVGRLSFEITEHTALASTELAERFSDDMRRLGCRLALDDFGTGFGSFIELRGMAVNKLKIDQSFVSGLLRNPRTSPSSGPSSTSPGNSGCSPPRRVSRTPRPGTGWSNSASTNCRDTWSGARHRRWRPAPRTS